MLTNVFLELTISVAVAAILTAGLAPLFIRLASRWGFSDLPNERSSHRVEKPRGIGVVCILVVCLVACLFYLLGRVSDLRLSIVLVSAVLVGGIGLIDDRASLAMPLRLVVHLLAACAVIVMEFQLVAQSGTGGSSFVIGVLAVLVLVWALNLYNFMDGIDGLALQQACFLCFAASFLLFEDGSEFLSVLLSLGVSCSVLLIWNWAPSKVFIGDVGSGFLGFLIAAIAWDTVLHEQASIYTWIILWGIFLVDSGWTLIRRAVSGQKWYAAHRSHAYQILARKWDSHARVSLTVALVNWLWLLPWAFVSEWRLIPQWLCVACALAPIFAVVAALGAGRKEQAL